VLSTSRHQFRTAGSDHSGRRLPGWSSRGVVFRGIVYRILEEWLDLVALIISAAIFGLAHLANPTPRLSSLAIALEAGLLLGAAMC